MEPVVLGRLKKQKSSKPAFVIICFMLLLGTCFGLPYIKDYINSKNDSFAIMVREILQKITGSDDDPVITAATEFGYCSKYSSTLFKSL